MARAVARAIASGRHLVVQAGTGTGKSFAYLVPSVASTTRVVVATATKALQDQLAGKDLPAVEEALSTRIGRPISYAVLKGRNNYVCLQRVAELESLGGADRLFEGRLDDELRRVVSWSKTAETGDRAELSFEPDPRTWAALSVGSRECPGASRCPQGETCFTERARARAEHADVVVVNTHLYGAHLASGGTVLPAHEVVVFDEAHQLEDVLSESLTIEVAPGRISSLAAAARPLIEGLEARDADLADVASALKDALGPLVGRRVQGSAPTGETHERSFFGIGAGGDHRSELTSVLELAAARSRRLSELLSSSEHGAPTRRDELQEARRARALRACGHLVADLARLSAPQEDEVLWVGGSVQAPSLRLTPIEVGPLLERQLWPSVTAVLTSATIPPRITERLRLDHFDTDVLDVGSPFDFERCALLYVARHLPDRRQPGANEMIAEEIGALATAAGGRTLALFTSRSATLAAATALRGRIPGRLLVQGELPKPRLLEAFASDETSSLFATMGFWQGVDVPGRSLSLVTIDRLPFGRPDDPVQGARRERAGEDAFALVDLPRAATLLAQGAGRLIRSTHDRGVVAVLDSRLATARYRSVLLDALPPMARTTERAAVLEYLRSVTGQPEAVSVEDPARSGRSSGTGPQ